MSPKFKIGDEVQRVSEPNQIGTVVEICEHHAGIQYYRVNFGATGRPKIGEIDLRPFIPAKTPGENLEIGNIDGYQEFQRLITYQRLLRDHPLRNNIYAFNASRTRFYPYQFKPLLKFLDSPKHRLLIADEVGLGKTIEAGLILTEMRARQTIQRVIVVCPANLTDKWRLELKKRFGEDFQVINTQQFLSYLQEYEKYPDDTTINGIVSLESLRQQKALEQLEALAPNFDLVVVDEAHHMRNFGRKQRRVGVLMSKSADAMLFLTGTPIHLGNENLFSLLNILDDEEFPDLYTVDNRFRNNEPIVRAQICLGGIPPNIDDALKFIEEIADSPWIEKNPLHSELVEKLREIQTLNCNFTTAQSMKLLLQAQRDLAELNLIGHIFSRTKKREVHTNMAVRRAFNLRVKLTDLERRFYNAVTAFVSAENEKRTDCPLIQRGLLIMPQRRMASSIPAMVQYYREHFGFCQQDISEDYYLSDENFDDISLNANDLSTAESYLQSIVSKWPKNGPDSKYDMFMEILSELRKTEGPLKIMVFAFFKDTLRYLNQRLAESGFKCAIITGDIPTDERVTIVQKFKEDHSYEVLLSSKVGSEGLDFQFCNILFNYDLPWNPMDVEQRIGRLDRIGQESPVIRIYSFWIENTIEEKILDRLFLRIGIFERSIGELEMILGDELSTLEFDVLSKKLLPQEEDRLIEQKAKVIMARLDALAKLEKEAAQFIGTDQYFDEEVNKIKTNRRYITGEQMRRFIIDFIQNQYPKTRLDYDSKKNLGKLQLDDKFRSFLTRYGWSGEAQRYFTDNRHGVPITFDSQTAFDFPNIDFINVLHPVTQSIVRYYAEEGGLHSNAHHVVLKTGNLPPGLYLYFVYTLKVQAARGVTTLEMVILKENLEIACSDEQAEIILGEMVENGQDSRSPGYEINPSIIRDACQKASGVFLDRVVKIREEVSKNNDAFINRRLESLRTSYGKSLKMRRELLEQAINKKRQERYIRMLEGTIRRLEFELEDKDKALQKQRTIEAQYNEIAAGILEVI